MDYKSYLAQGLYLQGIPVNENEIHHIYNILSIINQAEAPLKKLPSLNFENPITIFDKELLVP
ncbi:hypothetical protein ACFSCZ_06565 [Siminovitchia sediminis]|uniref:Uncharacterized protein n=1 Tax=Siminovitchia sediminis TaxID=1274353 RepID=A0ABW4KF34_9BACI